MQKIELNYLEKISVLIFDNYDSFAHAYYIYIDKKNKKHKLKYYNLLCTCILRIRETANYVNNFSFKRKNQFNQAFDFYEFINCLNIIFNCTESLLNIFGYNLSEKFNGRYYFIKSSKTRESDYKFFKFVRSAAVAHPDNTSRYPGIAKRNHEIYPYAIWTNKISKLLETEKDKGADISLLSWSSSEKSKYKRYYLYIDEFYNFINAVVLSVQKVIPNLEETIRKFKDQHRCKCLKKEIDFSNYHNYLMYLRKRILSLNTNKNEFPDGGILIADHIISNKLICERFKNYLKNKVNNLTKIMIDDFSQVGFDNLTDELDLYSVIKTDCEDAVYINEKFYSCLRKEAVSEIENNKYLKIFDDFILFEKNPQFATDAFYVVNKLFMCRLISDHFKQIKNIKSFTYADVYEKTLEFIYEERIANDK